MESLAQLSLYVLLFLGPALGWSLRIAPLADDASLQEQWRSWKSRFNKTYVDAHQETRAHALWLRHWRLVQSHNSRSDVTFSIELNAFADKEPKQETRGQKPHTLRYAQEVTTYSQPTAPPASFDWRKKGVILPVQNQGQMGSSDAIAVTEDLESLHCLRTGQLVGLSVREVVDCCSANPGMLVPDIYECIARHGGLCSQAAYPQHPSPPVCRNDSCQAVAKDAHVTKHVPTGNENALLMAVLQCPVVVYVDAGHASFQLYKSGVYSDPQCGHSLDHALQLVGYGTEQGTPYWILKNSWGAAWGMQGYILMKRGVNMCGIADLALYPQ